MILAAGLGSRLRPLTNDKPKALVEINGRPMLELLILRLKKFGVNEIIINVHHFADRIINFLEQNKKFGLRIAVSSEKKLLDTGGGLKQARCFFDPEESFLLHNVDVLTDLDYLQLFSAHQKNNALATLAVRTRPTSRYLLFDANNDLCGWKNLKTNEVRMTRQPDGKTRPLSFMGMHMISPEIFDFFPEKDIFSIIDLYLELAADERIIKGFPADHYQWVDMGKKTDLKEAERLLAKPGNRFSF